MWRIVDGDQRLKGPIFFVEIGTARAYNFGLQPYHQPDDAKITSHSTRVTIRSASLVRLDLVGHSGTGDYLQFHFQLMDPTKQIST